MPLAERLAARIAEEGPLTFATFMEMALYDPANGFYMSHSVGQRGEFLTSPHVSDAFGALLARQVEEFWHLLDRPAEFAVVEAGAGDGTLARQVQQNLSPAVRRAAAYWAIERSAAAREALAASEVNVASTLDELPPGLTGCVLANELYDNLPFHRLRGGKGGPNELFVDMEGAGFGLVEGPVSSEEVARLAPKLELGEEAVVSPDAVVFLDRSASALTRGYIFLIDYGWPSGVAGASVHGYRAHRLEEDVLEDPGSRDITAGVDFGALALHARNRGRQVWGPFTQRDALLALGFREWDEVARQVQVEALAKRQGTEALRAYSDRNRAGMLVRRGGLGDFLVLCVGIGGVTAPARLSAIHVSHDEEDAAEDGDKVGD
jgi:SAM-dependent MidA family methyltransferase